MDHLKDQSTVFNQQKFYFKILVLNFVNGHGQNFHVIGHKSETHEAYGTKNLYG